MPPILELENIHKTFVRGWFTRARAPVLHGISLQVPPGSVFGFLGPNGAGKTTTIRVILGLIRATAGIGRVNGHPIGSFAARQSIGFLPERPYFYQYLTGLELLALHDKLMGQDAAGRKARCQALLERVGLKDHGHKAIRSYSKGMQQRIGLAQALVGNPPLLILDEPMSGLDPFGRNDVMNLIGAARNAGQTVFLSSHILSDIEQIASHVAIIVSGRVRLAGPAADIGKAAGGGYFVHIRHGGDPAVFADFGKLLSQTSGMVELEVPSRELLAPLLDSVAQARAQVEFMVPRHRSLEDVFLDTVKPA